MLEWRQLLTGKRGGRRFVVVQMDKTVGRLCVVLCEKLYAEFPKEQYRGTDQFEVLLGKRARLKHKKMLWAHIAP